MLPPIMSDWLALVLVARMEQSCQVSYIVLQLEDYLLPFSSSNSTPLIRVKS